MSFESELKKGNFLISECARCKKIVWPPSEWCDQCLDKNSWRKCTGKGKIIEFSKKENTYFCVAEIENSVKILGELISDSPKIGKSVMIIDCGIHDNNYFFKMKMLD